MPYISTETAISISREMNQNEAGIDDVILVLRYLGFPQSICSIILSKTQEISSTDAKKAVLNSPAWIDRFGENISLQKELSKYLDED